MLEQIVQKFRGVVLLLVVFALSAVFVLQFGGPQAEGCSGTTSGVHTVAQVYDNSIPRTELQSAYVLAGGENYPEEMAKQHKLQEMVLYGLIDELLARGRAARRCHQHVEEWSEALSSSCSVVDVWNGCCLVAVIEFNDSRGASKQTQRRLQYRCWCTLGFMQDDDLVKDGAKTVVSGTRKSAGVWDGFVWTK